MTNDSTLVKWSFVDYPEEHDLVELCEKYLGMLKNLVKEAEERFA